MTTPLIIRTGLPMHDGDRKASEEITSISAPEALGSGSPMFSALLYQCNHYINEML